MTVTMAVFYFLINTVKFNCKYRLGTFYSCCKTLCLLYWKLWGNICFISG